MVGITGEVVVGSRGSALALAQTQQVINELLRLGPEITFVLKVIKTRGDRIRDVALTKMGGKGLFVKELEEALLAGEIDLAVHSLKDLPTEQPSGLVIGAVLKREDPRDALVSRHGLALAQLPRGARVGTGSLRRGAQLLAYRPDLRIADIRGNVDTRLRKLGQGQYDAVILAAAGLIRLGQADRITEYLAPQVLLPAVGQGALAVEVREADARIQGMLAAIDHASTRAAVTAERAFLRRLEGGCRVPIAAYGQVQDRSLLLDGLVASADGHRVIRGQERGPVTAPIQIGERLAEVLLACGAEGILQEQRAGARMRG
ncbi:MAG: hydroxymethylbilane synthase [Anaerolineae bacterium]